MSYIEIKNVNKIYRSGEVEIKALDNASFNIEKGELAVILGPSGAGKTTCLNILGGMDNVTSGEVIVDGIMNLNKMPIIIDESNNSMIIDASKSEIIGNTLILK